MASNSGVKTYTFNNLLCIEPSHLSICIKLIEECDPERQIRVRKKLYGFSFRGICEQCRNILLDCAFL